MNSYNDGPPGRVINPAYILVGTGTNGPRTKRLTSGGLKNGQVLSAEIWKGEGSSAGGWTDLIQLEEPGG